MRNRFNGMNFNEQNTKMHFCKDEQGCWPIIRSCYKPIKLLYGVEMYTEVASWYLIVLALYVFICVYLHSGALNKINTYRNTCREMNGSM